MIVHSIIKLVASIQTSRVASLQDENPILQYWKTPLIWLLSPWPETTLDASLRVNHHLNMAYTQFIMELAVQPPSLCASYLFHLLLAALLF